jgi:hypothetical protein
VLASLSAPSLYRRPTTADWAALGGIVLAMGLLFVPLPHPLSTSVVRYASDFGHAPLFAAIFMAVQWVLECRVGQARTLAAVFAIVGGGVS